MIKPFLAEFFSAVIKKPIEKSFLLRKPGWCKLVCSTKSTRLGCLNKKSFMPAPVLIGSTSILEGKAFIFYLNSSSTILYSLIMWYLMNQFCHSQIYELETDVSAHWLYAHTLRFQHWEDAPDEWVYGALRCLRTLRCPEGESVPYVEIWKTCSAHTHTHAHARAHTHRHTHTRTHTHTHAHAHARTHTHTHTHTGTGTHTHTHTHHTHTRTYESTWGGVFFNLLPLPTLF